MSDTANIIIELGVFRSGHQLGVDEVYDDIVAATIKSVESDYLSHYREFAGITNGDLNDEEKELVLKAFHHQVFNRLLKQASKFMLPEKSGDEAREIQRAVDNEMAQCHRIQHLFYGYTKNNDKSPSLARKNDFMQDFAETVISTSRQSVSVTDDIIHAATTHAAKSSLAEVSHASTGLHATGIAIQGFNFLLVPAFYIYYAAKREPVPFNVSNNIKWALSSIGLALAIVGVAVPPAGIAIMFTMVGIGLVASVAGLAAHIYERIQTKNKLAEISDNISMYRKKIQDNYEQVMELKKNIVLHRSDPQCYLQTLQDDVEKLEVLSTEYADAQKALKSEKIKQTQLKLSAYKSHSNLQSVNTGLQVVLACAFLVGAVLMVTPYTAPVGLIILAVAGSLGLASFIAGKIHQFRLNRQASKKNVEQMEAPEIIHPSTTVVSESLDPARSRERFKQSLADDESMKHESVAASSVKQSTLANTKQDDDEKTDDDSEGVRPRRR